MLVRSIESSNGILPKVEFKSGMNLIKGSPNQRYIVDAVSFALGCDRYLGMRLPIKSNDEDCNIILEIELGAAHLRLRRNTSNPSMMHVSDLNNNAYFLKYFVGLRSGENDLSVSTTSWLQALAKLLFEPGINFNDVEHSINSEDITGLIKAFVADRYCPDNMFRTFSNQSLRSTRINAALLLRLEWQHESLEEYDFSNVTSLRRYVCGKDKIPVAKNMELFKKLQARSIIEFEEIVKLFNTNCQELCGEFGSLTFSIHTKGFKIKCTTSKLKGKFSSQEEYEHQLQLLHAALYLAIAKFFSSTGMFNGMVFNDVYDLLTPEEFNKVMGIAESICNSHRFQFIYLTRA